MVQVCPSKPSRASTTDWRYGAVVVSVIVPTFVRDAHHRDGAIELDDVPDRSFAIRGMRPLVDRRTFDHQVEPAR